MEENQIVSIIVPVYNSQEFIEECINSIINQTYRKLEIILVDDGSADNSLQICNDIAQTDNRIIVLSQSNKGVVNARRNGVRRATGKYIMFVDSDDYVDSDYVEDMMKISKENELVTSGISIGSKKVYDCINVGGYEVAGYSPVVKNMIYAQVQDHPCNDYMLLPIHLLRSLMFPEHTVHHIFQIFLLSLYYLYRSFYLLSAIIALQFL